MPTFWGKVGKRKNDIDFQLVVKGWVPYILSIKLNSLSL